MRVSEAIWGKRSSLGNMFEADFNFRMIFALFVAFAGLDGWMDAILDDWNNFL